MCYRLTPLSSRNRRVVPESELTKETFSSFWGMPWVGTRVPLGVLREGRANASFTRRAGAPVGGLMSCANCILEVAVVSEGIEHAACSSVPFTCKPAWIEFLLHCLLR